PNEQRLQLELLFETRRLIGFERLFDSWEERKPLDHLIFLAVDSLDIRARFIKCAFQLLLPSIDLGVACGESRQEQRSPVGAVRDFRNLVLTITPDGRKISRRRSGNTSPMELHTIGGLGTVRSTT